MQIYAITLLTTKVAISSITFSGYSFINSWFSDEGRCATIRVMSYVNGSNRGDIVNITDCGDIEALDLYRAPQGSGGNGTLTLYNIVAGSTIRIDIDYGEWYTETNDAKTNGQ